MSPSPFAPLKTIAAYGLLAAVTLAALMFGPFFVFGAHPRWLEVAELFGYAGMLLCLSATWFAMRRERGRRGALRYGRAFAIGIGVSAVAAALLAAATYAFYCVAGDALPQAIYDLYVRQTRDAGGSEAGIADRLAELERMRPMFFDYPLQAAATAATVFVIGALESVVAAWFARSRPS